MADLTVCTVHTTTRPRGKPDTVSPHPSYAATAPPCMHSPPCPSPHKFPFFRVETKNVEQLSRACPADMMARRYRHACRFRCYQGAHALEPLQTAATHPAVWCGGTPASRAPYARHPPPHPTAPKKRFSRHRRGSALPRPHICEPPRRCRAAAAAGRPGGRCRRGAIGLGKPCDRGLTGFLHLDTAWNRRRRFRPPFHPPLKRRGRFQRARSRRRGETGKCRTGGTNLNVPQALSALWPKTLFGPISILSVAVKI